MEKTIEMMMTKKVASTCQAKLTGREPSTGRLSSMSRTELVEKTEETAELMRQNSMFLDRLTGPMLSLKKASIGFKIRLKRQETQ